MKKRIELGLVISWALILLGLAILLLFILGKSFGFIRSPVWVNYIPHLAGALTLLGLALQTGKVLQMVKDTWERVTKIDEKLDKVVIEVNTLKSKVDSHERLVEKMGERIYHDTPPNKLRK